LTRALRKNENKNDRKNFYCEMILECRQFVSMAAFRLSYFFSVCAPERIQTNMIEKTFTLKRFWNAGYLYKWRHLICLTSFQHARQKEYKQLKMIEKTFTLKRFWNAGNLYKGGIPPVLLLFDARAQKE